MKQSGNAGTGETRMLIHPALHAYTNAYNQPSDHYGSKVDSYKIKSRLETLKESKVIVEIAGTSSKLAETMVENQLDLFQWTMFYKDPNPEELHKLLKDAGITHIGMPRRPVEEVIVADFKAADVRALMKSSAEKKDWNVFD